MRETAQLPGEKKTFEETRTTRAGSARVIITEPQAVPVTVLYICQAVTSLCFPCVIASASAILISYPVVTFSFLYLKQVPQCSKGEALLVPKSTTKDSSRTCCCHSPARESRPLFPTSAANHFTEYCLKYNSRLFHPCIIS